MVLSGTNRDPPPGGGPCQPRWSRRDALPNLNRTVLGRVFWASRCSCTMVNKQSVLWLCIVNYHTTWDDVRETFEAVERFAIKARE